MRVKWVPSHHGTEGPQNEDRGHNLHVQTGAANIFNSHGMTVVDDHPAWKLEKGRGQTVLVVKLNSMRYEVLHRASLKF
jgi:hypothetical protein